jgi:hypothetical protein
MDARYFLGWWPLVLHYQNGKKKAGEDPTDSDKFAHELAHKLEPLDTDQHVGSHTRPQTSQLFFILKCGSTDKYPRTDSVIIPGTGNIFL